MCGVIGVLCLCGVAEGREGRRGGGGGGGVKGVGGGGEGKTCRKWPGLESNPGP